MKLIIAGSRDILLDIGTIQNFIDALDISIPDEIVCGGCRGVDDAGKNWAEFKSIPVQIMVADWSQFGAAAGPLRNADMADYADELLLIHYQNSKGSTSMKLEMLKRHKPIHEVILIRRQ